jgi:hypothetical protein
LDVFKRIEEQINAGFDTPSLVDAVARAVGLIEEVEGDWSTKCNIAMEAATEAAAVAAAAKAAVDELMSQKASLTSNTTSRGRTAQRTNRATDISALDKLLDKIVDAKMVLKGAKAAEKKAKDESEELHKLFEEWKEKFPHRTPDALLAHGKSILHPAGEYYNKLFLEEDGDCYNIRQMSEACLIFDPIELSKMSETDIVVTNHKRADLLEFFRYKQFTDDFIKRLKKEMPALVKEAGIMIWVGFQHRRSTKLGCKRESGERNQKVVRISRGSRMQVNTLNVSGSGGKLAGTISLPMH